MRAVFAVIVGGQDITQTLTPILISLRVTDKAGQSSDSCSIEIDDTDGRVILPRPQAPVLVRLGWEGGGAGTVFVGVVDEVQANGGRSGGRTLSISAKGMDTRDKPKQGQRRHFDNSTIEQALQAAGQFAGISVQVAPELAGITREYIALDDESFVAFGERIAREVGGTFKIVGSRAILAVRNGGRSVSGGALPVVTARWGANLHSYAISPILGRPVEQKILARWYDRAEARWMQETAETGTDGALTIKPALYSEPDQGRAQEQSGSDAKEADRKSGGGSVTIEGNIAAQPEGLCIVAGCRPGVDGTYRIDAVDHEYSRSSGFVTKLSLAQPQSGAGQDTR